MPKTSLRSRLLLLYTLLVGLMLAGMGIFIYFQAQGLLINNRTRQVREVVYWAVTQTEPVGQLTANDLGGVSANLSRSPSPDFSFFLFDNHGNFLEDLGQGTRTFTRGILSTPSVIDTISKGKEAKAVLTGSNQPYRILVYIFPVVNASGSLLGVLQTEARLDETDLALEKLKEVLIAGLGMAFLASCVLCFVFIRTALRPLAVMEEVSRAVAAGDLHQRAPAFTEYELRRTARTFNEMLESNEKLIARNKQNEKQLKQFLADMAHELRSPLTVLRGYVDMLLQSKPVDEPTLENSLLAMRTTLTRLTTLSNDMLTLSRLEAGLQLSTEKVDLNALCQEICDIVRVTAEGRQYHKIGRAHV